MVTQYFSMGNADLKSLMEKYSFIKICKTDAVLHAYMEKSFNRYKLNVNNGYLNGKFKRKRSNFLLSSYCFVFSVFFYHDLC